MAEKNVVEGYAGIEREIIELILQRKFFYGHFLQQFKRCNVDSTTMKGMVVRTLAVNITSDLKPNLYINTSFYNSGDYDPDNPNKQTWGLTKEEKMALLEHEILHMLNKHLIRVENRDSYVWNLAADIAINQYIKGLPDGGLCPDCNVFVRRKQGQLPTSCPLCHKQLDPKKHKCQALQYDKFEAGAGKIKLNAKEASEIYYDTLWKQMPKQIIMIGRGITNQREKNAKGMEGEGQGQGQDGKQGSGKGQDGKQGSGKDKDDVGSGIIEIDGQKIPIVIDSHEVWSTGADNKEMAHEKVRDMVRKAMHKASKTQGNLPDYVRGLVSMVLAHKSINWKSELRKFIGYEEFACFISSRKRLNRRFPLIHPGYVVQRMAHFVVAVDSSGSIGDKDFGKFFKEIDIMRSAKVSITYIECDADIQKIEEYKRRPKREDIERIGYGGTDFRPVFTFIKKRYWKNHQGKEFKLKGNKKIDGVIYLTDGMGSYPSPKDIICPTIWVMTANHNDYGWNEKLGKKIVMKDD